MINSHAHLDFDSMNTIAQNAIAIVPSIGNQNCTDVQMYPYFSFGIHPWMVESHSQRDLDRLEYLIKCNNPVAIANVDLIFIKI
jgi:TatD DNase family protein